MKNLRGMLWKTSGLMLRVGQFIFARASIVVMVTGNNFSNYTTLWILLQCQLVYWRKPINRGNWLIIMNLDMVFFFFPD